jgi:iron complex outermembrane receptor protein
MALKLNLKIKLIIFFIFFYIWNLKGTHVSGIEISGTQSGRWTLENSPYIITGNVDVPENASLIIESGVVVKFAGYYSINISGKLEAIGHVGKRIVFTSIHDKEFGVTEQPTAVLPTNEDWAGIEIAPSSTNQSKLEYCIIRYSDKAITATAANPTLNHIIIADCKAKNIVINGKSFVAMDGSEQDYIPIESTLNENILTNAIPTTTITEPQPIQPEVNEIFAEEEFTFGEITVISAARREQRITEAPAAITVITEDDIKYSGTITIPDVLRMVSGLDVMQISASDLVINARGYNKEMSNKMLVLIDGRYVYWDFYGIILWDSFPIVLEDIKKIEIIRGPGSALYGANAFSGVINIITKSSEEMRGTHVSITGGDINTYLGSVVHAGGSENLNYKFTLGFDETNQWSDHSQPSRNVKRAKANFEYKISQDSKIALEGGINAGKGETLSGIGKMNREQKMSHFKLDFNHANFNTRLFWSRSRGDAIQEPSFTPYYFLAHTYDIESQLLFNLGSMNSVIVGGNYRFNIAESDLIDQDHRQKLMAGYIQDEFRPIEAIAFTIGFRYDKHPLVKRQISPRMNIIISPFKEHYFRLSYGTAFRSPSFIESYLYENSDISAMISPLLPQNTIIVHARGNPNLLPEKITSYEIGYQALLSSRFRAKLDLFYNNLWDFISFKTIALQDVSAILGYPTGSVVVPSIKSYTNAGKSKAIGGEIGFDFLVTRWLMASVNYSYQDLTWEEDDPITQENEKGQPVQFSPRDKINSGLRFSFNNGLSANIMVHYVGKTEKNETWAYGKVDPYKLINVRLGYRFPNRTTEIGLSVFNLFDKQHYEYPGTDNQGNPSGSHKIGRRITGIFLSHSF